MSNYPQRRSALINRHWGLSRFRKTKELRIRKRNLRHLNQVSIGARLAPGRGLVSRAVTRGSKNGAPIRQSTRTLTKSRPRGWRISRFSRPWRSWTTLITLLAMESQRLSLALTNRTHRQMNWPCRSTLCQQRSKELLWRLAKTSSTICRAITRATQSSKSSKAIKRRAITLESSARNKKLSN